MTFNPKPLGNADLTHTRPAPLDTFWFGTTYYPEHWEKETRQRDAERMAAAGINVVRMAEFAGDLMEPTPGQYDFSLFDNTIRELGEKGIYTILCTPTATPPRWFSLQYPESLRVDANGIPMQHGSRQHCCHSSPALRKYSCDITAATAEHYKDNDYVIGWQTDNELFCHFAECHCENCQRDFPEFLREKFSDNIDALNAAWGNAFWALTYQDFAEIPTPRQSKPAYENPAHALDYYRYLSAAVTIFQHEQVELLRSAQSRWFVTHNGCFRHIDYRGLFTRDLDVFGYDVYPFFNYDPDRRRANQAFGLDRTRCLSGNFMVLEQQSGPGGQRPYFHDTPEPGEMRRMMYTSIARGADAFLHFRWRTCRFGAEEYWCGILDHDNVPRRRYKEACQEGEELQRIGSEILGSTVHIDAAVAHGDMEVADAHSTYTLGLPAEGAIAEGIHASLLDRGFAVGCVHPADNLTGLKLYVIPHWAYFDPAWLPNLQRYVEDGGILVIGARTATRDTDNNVVAETIPGCLRELTGITVEEYGRQNNSEKRPLEIEFNSQAVRSELWYETLQPEGDTRVIATWKSRHLDGKAAISCKNVGKGKVIYAGTYLTDNTWTLLEDWLAEESGLQPQLPSNPRNVEVVQRRKDKSTLWFIINHNDTEVSIPHPPSGRELLSQSDTGEQLVLGAYEVAVIQT